MLPHPLLNTPSFWVALYTLGLAIVLTATGPRPCRNLVTHRVPKPFIMVFMLIFILLPPLVLPFTEGPSIGLPPMATAITGGLLFAANIVIKIASQKKIGAVPALKTKATLMTEGIYRRVRHPLYMSNILMALGMALLFNSLYGLYFSIYYFFGFCLIVNFEEFGLVEDYGEQYRQYRQRVHWKMFPLIF